ncbi:MAG: hypothetical protein CFK52_08280 [Chloracidobacterium sp. CP2_5A]|nr:MAG: hypothetical protein CFK52_08280 [Chloracidobacterium sp. CP2_5A]
MTVKPEAYGCSSLEAWRRLQSAMVSPSPEGGVRRRSNAAVAEQFIFLARRFRQSYNKVSNRASR